MKTLHWRIVASLVAAFGAAVLLVSVGAPSLLMGAGIPTVGSFPRGSGGGTNAGGGTVSNNVALAAGRLVVGNGNGSVSTTQTVTSANVAATVSDETGSAALVFSASPALSNPTVTSGATFDQGGGVLLSVGRGRTTAPDVSSFNAGGFLFSALAGNGYFFDTRMAGSAAHTTVGFDLRAGGGTEPGIIRTYGQHNRTEQGATYTSYDDLGGGSGSALRDLPSPSDVFLNQRNPAFVIACGVSNAANQATMLSAISNFYAAGLGVLTNYNIPLVYEQENFWLKTNRDGSGNLAWRTDLFPMQASSPTNCAWSLRTNNFELWLMLYADSKSPSGANTEIDVDAFTGATFWENPNGANGIPGTGLMQPIVTATSMHNDMTTFYQWNVGGVTFQDTTYGAGKPECMEQMARLAGASSVFPGSASYPSIIDEAYWPHYWTNRLNNHGMIFNFLFPPAQLPFNLGLVANGAALESGVVITEPGSSGILRFCIGAMRPVLQFLTNTPAGTVHFIPQTDNLLYDGSWNYADCKDYLSMIAMNGSDEWLRSANGGIVTNTSFARLTTNVNYIRIWQDTLRGPASGLRCLSLGPTNMIFARPLDRGQYALWFVNEDPSVATNLTTALAGLGIPSNTVWTVTESWTNSVLGLATNSYSSTLAATNSQLVILTPSTTYNGTFFGDATGLTNLFATATNLGPLSFATNAGAVTLFELPVNTNQSGASVGTTMSVAMNLNVSNLVVLSAKANHAGVLTNHTTTVNSVFTVANGLTLLTNALTSWPPIPPFPGACLVVLSNSYPYMLLSTNGATGSAAWTGTNKIGW